MGRKFWVGLLLAVQLIFSAAHASEAAISEAVKRIQKNAGSHRLVVIGEMHGTREMPDLMEQLAENYSAEGPLLVALEITRDEHAVLARHMDSPDNSLQAEMRKRAAWNVLPEKNDGRRTQDMLDLIDALRSLRASGRDIAILPYDLAKGAYQDGEDRDRQMAMHIRRAYDALPEGRLLVLTGNVHAMLVKKDSSFGQQLQTPMASYLADLDPYSVNISALTGSIWACTKGCGEMQLSNGYIKEGPMSADSRQPYHFQIVLPKFTTARLVNQKDL